MYQILSQSVRFLWTVYHKTFWCVFFSSQRRPTWDDGNCQNKYIAPCECESRIFDHRSKIHVHLNTQ